MFLSEILDELMQGELSQFHVGGKPINGIAAEDWPMIVTHINSALTKFHTRFPLKLDEVIVQEFPAIQTYYLRKRFAYSNTESIEKVKYIMDSKIKPFKDNLLKIEQVFSEFGEECSLNDSSDTYTIYTPTYDSIVIPYNCEYNAVSVIYRANHDKIIVDDLTDPDKIEIIIPESMREPLIYLIAHKLLNSMNSYEDSRYYLMKYEQAAVELEFKGSVGSEHKTSLKLEMNGWV